MALIYQACTSKGWLTLAVPFILKEAMECDGNNETMEFSMETSALGDNRVPLAGNCI